ncbi:hypothetical protein PT974_01828 [Cladobotryum mycophilum]|uniref:Uncharacterized protein n=1 Tax=Cladobotryum mycophilum TaxID=491253 RepID=A0ABR0SWF0_9HYPO
MFGRIKTLSRVVGVCLLIPLPIYILPLINGGFEGYYLHRFFHEGDEAVDWTWSYNNKDPKKCPDHQTVAPFHIRKLANPSTWVSNLGVTNFNYYDKSSYMNHYDRLYVMTSLDNLYRKEEHGAPWHHWIYLTGSERPGPPTDKDNVWSDEWDMAFDQLLQYHDAKPSVGNASFSYVSCWNSFFCEYWAVKAPALIHLTTEKADVFGDGDEFKDGEKVLDHDPVMARIIEFSGSGSLPPMLAPGIFPSPYEQLKSLTADPYAWQLYEPHDRLRQMNLRIRDYFKEIEDDPASVYGRLLKLEDWWMGQLGLSGGFWTVWPRAAGKWASMTNYPVNGIAYYVDWARDVLMALGLLEIKLPLKGIL